MSAPTYHPTSPAEQSLWTFMTKRQRFTMADLKAATTYSDYAVEKFTAKLRRREILHKCARQGATVYLTVLDLEGALAFSKKKRGTKEGVMWAAIRSMKQFTPPEIVLALASGDNDISVDDATKYCHILLKGGYLRCVEKANKATARPARFRLVRNTGGLPPLKRNLEVIVDQNEDRAVWISGTRI